MAVLAAELTELPRAVAEQRAAKLGRQRALDVERLEAVLSWEVFTEQASVQIRGGRRGGRMLGSCDHGLFSPM